MLFIAEIIVNFDKCKFFYQKRDYLSAKRVNSRQRLLEGDV